MASLGRDRCRAISGKALTQELKRGHVVVQTAGPWGETISLGRNRVSSALFRRLVENKIIRRVAFWEKGNPRGKTSWYELTEKGRSL